MATHDLTKALAILLLGGLACAVLFFVAGVDVRQVRLLVCLVVILAGTGLLEEPE